MNSSDVGGSSLRIQEIVTGDRNHLLPIGSHQGIAIVTTREVVERLEAARE
jgi:hypothetical protein